LIVLLLIGGGGYLWYFGKPIDPVEQMHATMDDTIGLILSPLSASGNADALPNIAELKSQINTLHSATPPLNESFYRQAQRVCELLTIAATERNTFIKRLDQNRSATKPLMIVTGKRSTSFVNVHTYDESEMTSGQEPSKSPPSQREKKESDTEAMQREDVEMRVKHYEHAIIQQWNEKVTPYRNMITARYPDFSLLVVKED